MAAHMPVSAAVLCGGEGRRMGGADKSRLFVSGKSFIERQLDALRPLTPHLMLIDRDATHACPSGVLLLPDAVAHAGALGGIYTALDAAPTDRVLVLACDMPFVTTEFLNYLLACSEDVDVVIPRDHLGRHPLCGVFHRRIAPAFRARIEAQALRVGDALQMHRVREVGPDETARFDADGRLLLNVNTPQEYRDAVRGNNQGATFA